VDLLEDLLAAREDGRALRAPLLETGAFMRLVDGVVTAPAPRPVPAAWVERRDDDLGTRRVIPGIERELERALAAEAPVARIASRFAEGPRACRAASRASSGGPRRTTSSCTRSR